MKRVGRFAAVVLVGTLALAGTAEAAGTPCGRLTDAGWRASDISGNPPDLSERAGEAP
jgi:hypothetical protein